MNTWQNIGNGKKIKSLLDGKLVLIAPEDNKSVVPLFCECCNYPMKTADDSISFRKYGVCNHCNERWTHKPGVEWPAGPDKSSNEWKEYLDLRSKTSKPIITFK